MGLRRMKDCPLSANFSLCTFPYAVVVVFFWSVPREVDPPPPRP